jgi:hypothetical protein
MISIDLSPEVESKIQHLAQQNGQEPTAYLSHLIEEQVKNLSEQPGSSLEEDIWRMTHRTPEEILETRRRILASNPPPRELPEGKTLADVVVGKWPGDETDEEINALLDALS